jgi:hypothetical protein
VSNLFPLAASLIDEDVFIALVEGFAALGGICTFCSAYLAFLALVTGDSREHLGEAVNYGIAFGFVPGIIVGAAVFYSAATATTI